MYVSGAKRVKLKHFKIDCKILNICAQLPQKQKIWNNLKYAFTKITV